MQEEEVGQNRGGGSGPFYMGGKRRGAQGGHDASDTAGGAQAEMLARYWLEEGTRRRSCHGQQISPPTPTGQVPVFFDGWRPLRSCL